MFDPPREQVEAQQVLDELWADRLLPFKLTVGKIEPIGLEAYIVYFYDSRFYSVDVYRKNHQPFRDAVRAAVLAHLKDISGPFEQ